MKEHSADRGSAMKEVTPSSADAPCPSCAAASVTTTVSYVYAVGKIEPRFPRLSIEKEFAQARGRAETAGKTDQESFREVLSKPENRYLVRQLCWVMTVQSLEAYVVQPRDPADFGLLVETIRSRPSPLDLDVVIGIKGPIAPADFCNGLLVPIVMFDQIYSFGRNELIQTIPRPGKMKAEQFGPAAEEVFDRILLMTDNAGSTDEHRALNYLAMRYPAIYATATEEFAKDFSLTSVETTLSPLTGVRKLIDVIFSYTNRNSDFTEQFSVRVDVTEEFPFLSTKLSPYFGR